VSIQSDAKKRSTWFFDQPDALDGLKKMFNAQQNMRSQHKVIGGFWLRVSIPVGPGEVAEVWNEDDANSVSATIVAFKWADGVLPVGHSATKSQRPRAGQEVSHGFSIDLTSAHEVAHLYMATWRTVSPIMKRRAGGGSDNRGSASGGHVVFGHEDMESANKLSRATGATLGTLQRTPEYAVFEVRADGLSHGAVVVEVRLPREFDNRVAARRPRMGIRLVGSIPLAEDEPLQYHVTFKVSPTASSESSRPQYTRSSGYNRNNTASTLLREATASLVALRADVDFSTESAKFKLIDAGGRLDPALFFTFNTFLNMDTVCLKAGRPVGVRAVRVALGIPRITAPSEEVDV